MSRTDINESLRDIIKNAMEEMGGKIELEEAKELIRPYFTYDTDKLIENALTTKTRYIIYALKDNKGIRYCIANNSGLYIDLHSVTTDEDMEKMEKQIREKVHGLMKLWHKIRGKRKEIVGQITFDELDDFMAEKA